MRKDQEQAVDKAMEEERAAWAHVREKGTKEAMDAWQRAADTVMYLTLEQRRRAEQSSKSHEALFGERTHFCSLKDQLAKMIKKTRQFWGV